MSEKEIKQKDNEFISELASFFELLAQFDYADKKDSVLENASLSIREVLPETVKDSDTIPADKYHQV